MEDVIDARQVLQELEALSPAMREQVLLFVRFLKSQAQQLPSEITPSGQYDFSDLAGKLTWQGDAVAAQRDLRNEW